MIKIFQIITSVNIGGAENVVFNLIDECNLLYPKKFEFIVVEVNASKSIYSLRKKVVLRSKGIKTITLGGTKKRMSLLYAPFVLLFKIKSEKPAFIHSHTDLPDFVLAVAMKLFNLKGIKIIRTIHNTEVWNSHRYIGKFVESSFNDDVVVGVSKAALESYKDLRNKCKLSQSSKQTVIYNGCQIPSKDPHHFKTDPLKINVAFCGRFVYQKGIDILIKSIQMLGQGMKNSFLFHFIGDGPNRDMVLKLIEKNENVILYGPVNNLSAKIYAFDYLIMPSRFEGLPLISVESSLSKVPVIASRAKGLNETLPIDWPLFFDLDDLSQIEKIFKGIFESNYDIERLKEISWRYVIDKFSIDEMANSYSRVYLQTD